MKMRMGTTATSEPALGNTCAWMSCADFWDFLIYIESVQIAGTQLV